MQKPIVFNYSKLRGRIVEKYNTQGKFAEAVGLTDRSVSLKLNNGIGFSQDEIINWCELLNLNSCEIPAYFFDTKV